MSLPPISKNELSEFIADLIEYSELTSDELITETLKQTNWPQAKQTNFRLWLEENGIFCDADLLQNHLFLDNKLTRQLTSN